MSILVFNQARMGDLLESSPLLHKIRRIHPDSRITLAVLPEFVKIAGWLPDVDEVVAFNDAGLSSDLNSSADWVSAYQKLAAHVWEWKKRGYDLAYNLVYNKAGALFLAGIGVRQVHGLKAESNGFFSIRDPWSAYLWNFCQFIEHNPFNITDLFRHCGEVDSGPAKYGIRSEVVENPAGRFWLERNGLAGTRFVAIQPGSNSADRRIDPAIYSNVADSLAAQGFKIVVLGSPREQPLVKQVLDGMRTKQGIEGICSLEELCGILNGSSLLLTNDTGTMHLAAALEVPILLVCSGISNPAISGPYREGAFALTPRLECQPCRPSQICDSMYCRSAIKADTIGRTALWILSGGAHSQLPGPFEEAEIQRFARNQYGFLCVRPVRERMPSATEAMRELWGHCWLHFAGYREQVESKRLAMTSIASDTGKKLSQLSAELRILGQGLIDASNRLGTAASLDAFQLLSETKSVLAQVDHLINRGAGGHLHPYRVMLKHLQEHTFDPDPKKSVSRLAKLFGDFGESMIWTAGAFDVRC